METARSVEIATFIDTRKTADASVSDVIIDEVVFHVMLRRGHPTHLVLSCKLISFNICLQASAVYVLPAK